MTALASAPNGATISAAILVCQEDADAIGKDKWHGSQSSPDAPETMIFRVDANAVGGERFVEGTAMVCYFAEERYKGKDRAQMIAHEGSTAS